MDVREIVFNRCQRKLYFLTAFELDHFLRFLYVFFFFIGEKLEAICKLKSCFVVIQSFKWRVI